MFSQVEIQDFLTTHGIGLGLKISKLIVEELGGQIYFKTEIGKGTVFTIRLPLRQQ